MIDPFTRALLTTIDVLEKAGIEYAVTGSFAAAQHGYVRATEDVDVAVVVADVAELELAAERLPPGVRRTAADTWRFDGSFDVELYPVRDALDRAAMVGKLTQRLRGSDRDVCVVPLEALLALKVREHVRHGHGLKHIADVQALLVRNHDKLDLDELERLLGLGARWRKAWEDLIEPGPM